MRRKTWNSWTFCKPEEKPVDRGPAYPEREHGRSWGKRRGDREATALEQTFQRNMEGLLERAMDLSEVRMERVARIKASLSAGTYQPDVTELAQKLLETMRGEFR